MNEVFDVRAFLKIPKDKPLELRICHIATLWYEKVLRRSKKNHFGTINDLFPNLILRVKYGKEKQAPEYQDSDNYINVYTYMTGTTRRIYQGMSSMEYQTISRLVGAGNTLKYTDTAKIIQKRVAKELCGDDDSFISKLQAYYTDLINELDRNEIKSFKSVFTVYITTVIDDLANFPEYRTPLFPFDSKEQIHTLNNYLSKEFSKGNYVGFFLWMNLGALLRDRIQLLLITFDSTFERITVEKEVPRTTKKGIPLCLTPIPPINHRIGLVGREKIQKTVVTMLEEQGRMALVSGLGGIGKTAVMQWICNAMKEDGKYVAWINCGDRLKDDLLVLGDALEIPVVDTDTAYGMIIRTLKSRLNGSLYLFMDDLTEDLGANELSDLYSLNAHIMVTSRKTNDAFPTVALKELEYDQAVTMFFRYYNGDTDRRYEQSARSIITSVNTHTLLIELLAKAAKKTGGTLEDFNKRLKTEGVYDVFKRKVETSHDGNTTIEDCVMRLYEVSPLSKEHKHILKLFSIFTPEKEIFYKVTEWAGLNMDKIDELVDLAWLERTGPENNYKIHQIIKDSLARQLKNSGEILKVEEYCELLTEVANTENYMPKMLEFTKVRERLTLTEDIAKYLTERISEIRFNDVPTEENLEFLKKSAFLYHNIAGVYSNQGDYGKTLDFYEKDLAICERVFGPKHPSTAATYNNIAGVYYHQGNYEKTLDFYMKALAIKERVLGTDHPDTAATYNNMASVYKERGDHGKALEFYVKALAICERVFGTNHPSTAATYNNMALVYTDQGDYEKALDLYMAALSIHEKVFGHDHPDTAATYNSMALMYSDQGDYGMALDFFRKSLTIKERMLGTDHPSTATTYNNMAGVFADQGDYIKALEFYEKALDIREKVFGHSHPSTASTYNNMAGVYKGQYNYSKALEFYRKALAICEMAFGHSHPSTASTYNNMAGVFADQGDYDKALKFYGKALDIRENIFGPSHPSTAAIYNNMAGVYKEKHDYGKALEFYKKALAIHERIFGPNHPSTATTYNNIASLYKNQGNHGKALDFYRKALDIREKIFGPNHPSTAAIYNNMAGVYKEKHDYGKALEFYKKALAIHERVFGTDHPSTATTYNNIAGVYFHQNNYKKALDFYEKALTIKERVLGADHPSTATTYNNMALMFLNQNDYEKTLDYLKKALAIQAHVLGTEHPDTKATIQAIEQLINTNTR